MAENQDSSFEIGWAGFFLLVTLLLHFYFMRAERVKIFPSCFGGFCCQQIVVDS